MTTYRTNISVDVPEMKPDLTNKFNVSISASQAVVDKINDYLAEASAAFRKGAPYSSDFDYLEDFEKADGLPFEKVAHFKIVVEELPIERVGDAINLLAKINNRFPQIGVAGKSYTINAFFGARMVYALSSSEGDAMLHVEQSREPATDGDTDVSDPVVEGEQAAAPNAALDDSRPKAGAVPSTAALAASAQRSGEASEAAGVAARDGKAAAGQAAPEEEAGSAVGMDFATLVITLLSDDWVFFEDDEIAWDGKHHQIRGIQVNGAQIAEFMDFIGTYFSDFESVQEVVNYFIAFMNEAEKDEGLIVPRGAIAQGIRKAIREGKLTAITLANLAACGHAIIMRMTGPNEYAVVYDSRLSQGIPQFFNLFARLVWNLRQAQTSLKGVPFTMTFMVARNIDADEFFGNVRKPVPGAQENPGAMRVTAAPEIDLTGESEPDGASDSGASLFDPGIEGATEQQSDEELFDLGLLALARSFPVNIPIEGTHHCDRASRIENVQVGDKLVLKADWQNPWYSPVAIEVFDTAGGTLGYLSVNTMSADMLSNSGYRGLACLLPYVTASAESVTPLSKRSNRAKYALMDVRLELDSAVYDGGADRLDPFAIAQAKKLLAKPAADRAVTSKLPKGAAEPVLSTVAENEGTAKASSGRTTAKSGATAAKGKADTLSSAVQSKAEVDSVRNRENGVSLDAVLLPDTLHRLQHMRERLVTGNEFVSLSEAIVGELLASRQQRIDDETQHTAAAYARDRKAMRRIGGEYNQLFTECVTAYLDVVEAQGRLGTSAEERLIMLDETAEVNALVSPTISIEGGSLESVTDVPVPQSLEEVRSRLNDLRSIAKRAAEKEYAERKRQQRKQEVRASADQAKANVEDADKKLASYVETRRRIAELKEQAAPLEDEIAHMGLFAGKKKKEAKRRLAELGSQIDELEESLLGESAVKAKRDSAQAALAEAEVQLRQLEQGQEK